MEESGNGRASSDAPTKHQDGITDVKKDEVLFSNLFARVLGILLAAFVVDFDHLIRAK